MRDPSPSGQVALQAEPGRSRFRRRRGPASTGSQTAWAVIGSGIVAIAVYYYLGADGQNGIFSVFGVWSVAAATVATWRSTGRARLIWAMFASGLVFMVLGDTLFDYTLTSATWPDWPDYVYLLSMLPLMGGVFLLAYGLARVDRAAAVVDAAIVTAAITLVQWIFVTAPVVDRHDDTIGAEVVLLAYCAADLFMLITLSRFAVRGMRLGASHWLVAGAILAWGIGDEGNALSPALPFTASWADSLWLLAYVLWIAAAVVPSSGELGRVVERGAPRLSLWRVSPVAPALLTVPVVLGIEASMDNPKNLTALVIGSSVLGALVVVRVFGLRGAGERARNDLAERNRRLEELDELRDTLLASVSHDLRTPLTSILGNAELALECEPSGGSAQLRRSLEVIHRNARRLAALVEDLLFVTTASVGGLDLAIEPVDLEGLIRANVEAVRDVASRRGIEIGLRIDSERTVVLGDPRRIGRLLDNVLDNAIKYTPEGSVNVVLGRADDFVTIDVIDTGRGIDPGEVSQMFEPFYRGVASQAHGVEGSGLGLHIAKAIVDAHGGTIGFSVADGAGTACRIRLPVVPPIARSAGS